MTAHRSIRIRQLTPRSLRCLVLLYIGSATAAWAAAPPTVAPTERQVLPAAVVPEHYDLALFPNAADLTFRGRVAITLSVSTPTPTITLNAVGLAFDHASVDGGKDAQTAFDAALGQATLRFPANVSAGRHVLTIEYRGKIGRSTLGFFAMDYATAAGPRRTLATNFEPTDARDLLPCWDEPARKATFTVSVDVPKGQMAVGNMPIAKVTAVSDSLQHVRFQDTPKMSTYLLFLGMGDFERITRRIDNVDVGVVVKRGDTAKATYALEQAVKLLHYYNGYFGTPYPLPKLDLIAAPGQIQGGSMENWGAIFYSQDDLLFDPKTSTERDRQGVFLVVSHEMAHQWFGDLVTMAWWDELWLNEGFARWMQTYAADDLHPEWQTGLQALRIYDRGKAADSVPSTHPIVQQVFTAEQAIQSFDAITYDKGAAVITMLNAYVGRDKFRDGVRRYIHAHAYGNTVDSDLWRVMQDAAGLPILDIEHDFTRQEGLPLVSVAAQGDAITLTTTRFAEDPASIANVPAQHWRLPIAMGLIDGPKPYQLLQGKAQITQKPPVLVNAGQLAYARVLYSASLFQALSAHTAALQPMDQLGLLNDAWAFGKSGYAPASNVLRLMRQLPSTANPIVLKRVVDLVGGIDHHYADTPQRVAFRRFALGLLKPFIARLGLEAHAGEASNDAVLRERLLETAARFGDTEVIAFARRVVDSGVGSVAEQRTATDIVAAQADAATFDRLLKRARDGSDPLVKLHLFEALAGVSDSVLAKRMLEVSLTDEVPAGSNSELISTLSSWHPDLIWAALAPRLDDPKLPFTKIERWDLAEDAASASADAQRIKDVEAYEARSVPPEARRPFLAAIASIQLNRRIAQRVLPEIDQWIAGQSARTGGS
jgi:aminopeptidase N